MRRLHIVLTIGGGFVGVVVTLQAFFAAKESNPMFYALLVTFIGLFAYGIYAGLRFADNPSDTKHLIAFYWLQVPWLSSPLLAYRFASGFHVTGGFVDSKLSMLFRIGSDWQFSTAKPAPWGLGINVFALVVVILLMRKKPNKAPEPTTMAVTPRAIERLSE